MPIKILQITNKPAYPTIDGGCLGMAKMSGFYDSNSSYSLDIFTIETQKHSFDKTAFENNLKLETSVSSVYINTKPTVYGVLKYYFGKRSYNLSRFYSKEVEQKILDLLQSNEYDIIQFENIFVAQYFPFIQKISKAKLVLNSANVEYEIWERLSKKSGFIKGFYFNKLAKQLKAEEINIWKNMDGIISATDKDKAQIEKITLNKAPTVTIPFYLNLKDYKVKQNENITNISFYHIGAMDWLPNVEGVFWLLSEIWNSEKLIGNNSLNLAGKSMPITISATKMENLTIQSFVEDAKEFSMENDVLLVPIFSGSGIRVKIIEAMAHGKCVISTTIGAEGINYTNDENILIANTKEEFIEKMNFLTKNTSRIREIGQKARFFIENEHDVSLMEIKLNLLFQKLM